MKIFKKLFLILSLVVAGTVLAATPENGSVACTMQYDPVCAQQTVYCIKAPCPQPEAKTYGNSCMAGADGARILYKGECEAPDTAIPPRGEVICTADAKICEDGSSVGRSGPNCEFICPTNVKPDLTQEASPNCKSWFDGCNNCSRGFPLGPMGCTKKLCAQYEEPKCNYYFGGEENQNTIDYGTGPTTPPEVGFIEPTSPPPSEELEEEKKSFVKRIITWFTNLFRF